MSEFEYITATDFDRAWLNFELDLPLKPGPNGEQNSFYVNRPKNPIPELIDALLAPFYRPPKFFFFGTSGLWKIDGITSSHGQSWDSEEILADQFQYP